MRHRTAITIVTVALSAVALTACGSSSSKTIETKDGKVTVNKNGKSVTIQGENGNTATFGGAQVPAGFPSEVPLPKGLTLKSAAGGSQSNNKFFSLAFDLGSTSAANAADAYKSQLADAGFTVSDSGSFGTGGASVHSVSADGKGWRVAASGLASKLFTLVVTSAN